MTIKLNDASLLKTQCLIGAEWKDAISGEVIEVNNPATGEVVCTVPKMGGGETRQAIEVADAAFQTWRRTSAKERSVLLRRLYDLMIEHSDDLAMIMTVEQGKPLAEAKGEITYSASFIEWFSEEARRMYGDTIPGHQTDKRVLTIKQAIGVVGAITPWNFPSAMIGRKAGPALASGCSIVVKPASQTPLSALALGELALRAGIPPGVLNIVTGKASAIGDELTANPTVRKLTFTGSTAIGVKLLEKCAPTVKKVSMELGGNAPFIVFDDADLEAAVAGAIQAKYRNSGQTCVCPQRFFVQKGIYDAFAEKLVEATSDLVVGPGVEKGVNQGPLINEAAVAQVRQHILDAVGRGAKIVAGGDRHALGRTFFQPTVLTNVDATSDLFREETFGPLSALIPFETEEEALKLANDSEFGLAAYVYTRDNACAWRVSEELESGMVGVNTGMVSTEIASVRRSETVRNRPGRLQIRAR